MDTTGVETARSAQKSTPAALPVTLLSGFLGSGKTTLLKRILENKEGLRVAVIVNDMASVNIDASLVSSTVIKTQEKLVSLTNGCICCTLREDLLLELASLSAVEGSRFDVVVIESTGISEPMQVAETFTMSIPIEELRKAAEGGGSEGGSAGLRRLLESLSASNSSPVAPRTPGVKKARLDEGNISRSKKGKRRGKKRGGDEDGDGGADESNSDSEGRGREVDGEGAACEVHGADCELCLSRWARLDTCVTVVDAARFWDDLHSIEDLSDRARSNGDMLPPEGDDRSIAALLLDQIEFADVLILNKVDLIHPQAFASSLPPSAPATRQSSRAATTESLVAALRKLNPRATIIPAKMCDVPLSAVIKTGKFDLEAASNAPGWLQSLRESAEEGGSKKVPETEEYGISSFVYRARRPFAPSRLYRNFLREFFITTVAMDAEEEEEEEEEGQERDGKQEKEEEKKKHKEKGDANAADADETPASDELELQEERQRYERKRDRSVAAQRSELGGTVLRSKGFAWMANRDDSCVELSAAGVLASLSPGAPWFSVLQESEWMLPAPRGTREGDAAFASIRADFAEGGGPGGRGYGDRRQEIVFIGQGIDESKVRRALDACLATDEEIELAWKGELSDFLFGEDEEEESEEE